MTILDLIQQCEIRLEYLKNVKLCNTQLANFEIVNKLDIEILQIEQTLDKLRSSQEIIKG